MPTHEQSSYRPDPELRARLQAFSPDEPGAVFPFSARLAREQGWTRDHASRVTREYLRFVYLAATAGHPVTPSKMVDEAWHLHLTYTRSYWDDLCGRVLGRPLHHEPTRGGGDEDAKFADWYARTLDGYRAAFGEEPPADIWPRPAGAARVETAAPAWRLPDTRRAGAALFFGSIGAAVAVGACIGVAREKGIGVMIAAAAPFAIFFLAITVILRAASAPANAGAADPRRRRTEGGDAGCGFAGADGGSGGGDGGHGSCGGHSGCGHGGCGGGHGCGSGCGSSCGGGCGGH